MSAWPFDNWKPLTLGDLKKDRNKVANGKNRVKAIRRATKPHSTKPTGRPTPSELQHCCILEDDDSALLI